MINTQLIQSRALLARQQLLHQQQQKRLARRIHDDISQQLTLLSLQLSLAQVDPHPPANWAESCQQWSAMVLDLGQRLRGIINDLQPRILDDLGLSEALQWYAQSSPNGVHCKLILPGDPVALAPEAANELFAICRDIVSEVLAPNGVAEAVIALEQTPDLLRLHLSVNEKNSTPPPPACKELDALSIQERLLCLDGAVETRQDPALGFTITLSVPLGRQSVSQAA